MITNLTDLFAACEWMKRVGYTRASEEKWPMPPVECRGFEIVCTGLQDRWCLWARGPDQSPGGVSKHRHLRGEDLYVAPWVVESLMTGETR